MYEIILGFLSDFFDSLVGQWLAEIQTVCGNLCRTVFFLETVDGLDQTVLSSTTMQSAFNAMYGICVLLVVIKLLTKGWDVYVLWRDGDPEVPPGEMLTGAGWAIIVTAAFPILYELGINVVFYIVDTVLAAFPVNGTTSVTASSGNFLINVMELFVGIIDMGGFLLIVAIVYIVVLILLVFQMMARGGELLIYRLGIPLAAVGLVNSDGGAWNNYIQLLLKQIFTTMIQYFCLVLGIRVMTGVSIGSLFVGVALEIAAFAAPKILGQILTPRGSGVMQKISTVAMVVRTFAK